MTEPAIDLPGRGAGATGGDHPAGEPGPCFICGVSNGRQVEIFGKWMCRFRVPCYQRWLGKR